MFARAVARTIDDPGSAGFAWTLTAAIALLARPAAAVAAAQAAGAARARPGVGLAAPARVWAAVTPLLLGSVCAQLLLNGSRW